MVKRADLCGWSPNPEGVAAILADRSVSGVTRFGQSTRKALTPRGGLPTVPGGGTIRGGDPWQNDTQLPDEAIDWRELRSERPILLYEPLIHFMADWKRDAQGIGDCVSHGWELGCTIASAVAAINSRGEYAFGGEYATEPIYGGSRVEARGQKRGGWSDGSYGAAAAKWVTKWGALRRANYSHVGGGGDEYDLRSYDSKKAKNWGNYGCGGKNDADKLDEHAREFPVGHAALVTNFDDAALSIANGYPIPVCSGYGFGKRGRDGIAPRKGIWRHCMSFIGVRFDTPALLMANSWGNSWGTKDPHFPEDMPAAVQKCTAWVSKRDVDGMLRGQDSFAVGKTTLTRQPLVWLDATAGFTLGRSRRWRKSSYFAAA